MNSMRGEIRRYKMQVLKLEVQDAILDKVMFFLRNLPTSQIKLNVETAVKERPKKLKSISIRTKGFKFDRDEANAR